MKVLHITPKSNGYEEVDLIANRVDRNNHLSVIEDKTGVAYTGGILLNDTPEIREILDSMPKEKQYYFVRLFRETPYKKLYLNEN